MNSDQAEARVRRLELKALPESVLFEVAGTLPAPAFLDSTLAGKDTWSFLAAAPSGFVVDALPPWSPRTSGSGGGAERVGFPETAPPDASTPPFGSGWIGFLAYESAPLWTRDLSTRADGAWKNPDTPSAVWLRYEASLAFHHTDQSWWISESGTGAGRRAAAELSLCLERATRTGPRPFERPVHVGEIRADLSREDYVADVETIREWIARGHVYQANLTYRMRARFEGRGLDLYPRLRRTSPVPFGAYLRPDLPGADPASSSLEILAATPELFLSVSDGRVTTRPIKGTRPRDLSDPARDRALSRELFTSPKDRAELTMIVDLERNDLGRVCRYGTILTSAFPRVESYRGVHHLVADVTGELREGTSLRDLLAATFPGGSITGAPKIRAMELIREIERTPREIYTGALGYLDDRGSAALSLTIRTVWITPGAEREVRFGVGGGIVTDSVPEEEWRETRDKARTLLEALDPESPAPAMATAT